MNRTPPTDVLRTLRQEVGFCCPIEGCGSPYLTFHHFDPPWHEQNHHNPEGMIALCPEHHNKADVGTFTREQLHAYKAGGYDASPWVQGRFDWMRNDLLTISGGLFWQIDTILVINGEPILWYERDSDDYLLLNLDFDSIAELSGARCKITDNVWVEQGNAVDITCPPSGKSLDIRYDNGDFVKVFYHEIKSDLDIFNLTGMRKSQGWNIEYPIVALELHVRIERLGISITRTKAISPGMRIEGGMGAHGWCVFNF